ncbi:MAG: heme NO-binding domain-containing protein [Bacteroidia bacterium]|nr:heme NO-binding domain-containing protein [Bacteroidia bacterium]
MVEQKFSIDMVDEIIEMSELPHGGAYTSVGTYSHLEMNALVSNLSQKTGIPLGSLLVVFGEYLFQTLAKSYPHFINGSKGLLDFLGSIENYIHIEVKKLYPDAELPKFSSHYTDKNTLELTYQSERHYGDLAEGLIIGAIQHFKTGKLVHKEKLADGSVKFVITTHG